MPTGNAIQPVTPASTTPSGAAGGALTGTYPNPGLSSASIQAGQNYGGIFGDGSDGAATFDGIATVIGMVPAANVYTMTRDIFCTSITINNGITLKPAGYRIFCTGTVTNNGTITYPGNNAAGSVAGGFPPGGSYGGSQGATGVTGVGVQTTLTNAFGTAGVGAGGAGGSGTSGAGGATKNPTFATAFPYRIPAAMLSGILVGAVSGIASVPIGGIGGSSGSGDGSTAGGGGGSGAGIITITAPTVVNGATGTISSVGGNGGTPGGGNCGGGGGGGGGNIIVYTLSAWTNSGTTSVIGGTKGTHTGTGADGSNGGAGTVLNVVMV